MADYEMIDSQSRLEELAKELAKEEIVAVDTEADSFYHYFDKTCLVQVATKRNAYVIDPLALGGPAELAPLGPVFSSPDVCVVFHAAEYDIFVLKRDCGFTFANLFDTMVSSQLLGYSAIGLAALIEHHFGLKIPKDEQRSDWSRRPLTEKQLAYAVGDVLYLIRLAKSLKKELKKAGRLEWAEQDFATLVQREWTDRGFDKQGYLRIKGARKLDPDSLGVLHQLYLVRDARAREVDRPPFKVLGNRTLLEITEAKPTKAEDLARIKGVSDLIIRRMGAEIIAAVKKGQKESHGPIPKSEGNGRRRMDRRADRRLTQLKHWRSGKASELKMDPGVLCPNAALESIAWRNPDSGADLEELPELKGWFVREFGDEVAAALGGPEAPEAEQPAKTRRRRS
ncbi:MAG: HRDC domain-containing protein [Deltaproteobacteria bacterium]|nr:HRDC domain-containing protein [Deltaproteobacteria bacterium]MBW2420978.1 HRDC domain-containing protein [Deltaproteobacteria bacterium]